MAKKKSETVRSVLLTSEVKERWMLFGEKEYPVIMAEYSRLILENTQQTKAAVNSIKNWVTFFGVISVLAVILWVLGLLLQVARF